jgi:HEAT repeat protein
MKRISKLQYLIRQLAAKDWKTRQSAAQRLGELNNREATPHLVKRLKDRSVKVRHTAMSALVELNDPAVVQPFLDIFLNPTDHELFYMAARGLGKLKSKVAIQPLRSKFNVRHVNDAVMYALLEYGEDAYEPLRSMLESGTSYEKYNAAHAIRQWWFHNSHKGWIKQVAIPLMINNLTDSDDYTRGYTATVLCDTRDPRAFNRILELAQDASGYVRWCIAGMIEKYGDQQAIPALEWICDNDKDYQIVMGQEETFKQYNADVAREAIVRLRSGKPRCA